MEDVAGKVAFVTGDTSGTGLGMAKAFRAVPGIRVAMAGEEQAALKLPSGKWRAQEATPTTGTLSQEAPA